jgi:hypothetical protein
MAGERFFKRPVFVLLKAYQLRDRASEVERFYIEPHYDRDSPAISIPFPYFIAFLTGNGDELRRSAAVLRSSPAAEDLISHLEALALARSGRLEEARRLSTVPVAIAQRAGRRERGGLFEAAAAVWEALYGNAVAARQRASAALQLGSGRDIDYAVDGRDGAPPAGASAGACRRHREGETRAQGSVDAVAACRRRYSHAHRRTGTVCEAAVKRRMSRNRRAANPPPCRSRSHSPCAPR